MLTTMRLAEINEDSYTAMPTWQAEWPHGRIRAVRYDEAEYTVIAWPGTASRLDVLIDLLALPRFGPAHPMLGRVHWGAIDALDRLSSTILKDLDPAQQIIVIGHSLGGAYATLFVAEMVQVGWAAPLLYTFGAMACMAAGNDLLPALLAPVDGIDFRHADDPVPFAVPGFGHPRWPRCRAQLSPMHIAFDVISDHFIGGYKMALLSEAAHAP